VASRKRDVSPFYDRFSSKRFLEGKGAHGEQEWGVLQAPETLQALPKTRRRLSLMTLAADLTLFFVPLMQPQRSAPPSQQPAPATMPVNQTFSSQTDLSEAVFDRFMALPQGSKIQAEYICT
jgi:hypothetical protein